jgi:uncharacterized delta-60 repeat protein
MTADAAGNVADALRLQTGFGGRISCGQSALAFVPYAAKDSNMVKLPLPRAGTIRSARFGQRGSRSSRRPSYRPLLERLEDRCLLSAGDLDTTFGTGGKVNADFGFAFGPTVDNAYAVTIQPDGKVVVAGTTSLDNDMALMRFQNNGTLDSGFGTGGKVHTNLAPPSLFQDMLAEVINGLAIQPDEKIVAVGYSQDWFGGPYSKPAVVRYLADGTAEIGGTLKYTGEFKSVALQPADGKIVAAGYVLNGANKPAFAVARINSNGTFDTTFGSNGDGVVVQNFAANSTDVATSIVIQADGKVLLAGTTGVGQSNLTSNFGLMRLTATGQLDTSFGTGGKVIRDIPNHRDEATGAALQSDGTIVVVGTAYNNPGQGNDIAVERFGRDGTYLNGSWSDLGNHRDDEASGVAVQPDGKILVAGRTAPPGRPSDNYYDFALVRLNPEGDTYDSNFQGGWVTTDIGGGNDGAAAVTLTTNSRIVVAGLAVHSTQGDNFALARYEGGSAGSLQFSDATYSVSEGDSSKLVTVTRTGGSDGTVTVQYATANGTANSGSDYTATSGTLTFAQGETTKNLSIPILEDALVEDSETVNLTLSNPTGGAALGNQQTAVLTITDNDTAGVVVTQSSGSTNVTEGGATDTYTVALTSQPTANVTITLTPGSQLSATPLSLIFTAANWNVAQTVTVGAVNDSVAEGNHTGTITHAAASADPTYNGIAIASVTANITDNDVAGVVVVQSGGSTNVTEGGATDSYTFALASQPTASVTVTLNPGNQLTATPSSLTFTAANWNVPQTITVTAVDDSVVEDNHTGTITHTVASSDPNYNGTVVLTASILDNDTAGVVVTPSGGSTSVIEGGATDSYSVALTSQPTANVTITLTPNSQLTATPLSLTFTAANWNVAQTVTVSAVNDSVAEGNHTGTITHAAASADPNYNGLAIASVTANITDNDVTGVVVVQSGGSTNVTEGGATDSYTVVLTSQPTANVTVTLTPGSQLTATPLTLIFTAANWSVPQTVTVTAVDDLVVEGTHTSTITHAAASSDATYNGFAIASVTATITDNDTAGVVVAESGGSTSVAEGGASDTYTVLLTNQPTADVTITMTLGSQLTAAPTTLTFTAANWNVAQTVTVSAVNDNIAEGNHTGTITHAAASADPNYNGLAIASVTAAITDNDTAGVTVTQSGGSTNVAEGGASDSYSLALTSQPTANVSVTLTSGSQLTAAPLTLTFTAANWNVPQTVTVTAVDDLAIEGTHTGTITHAAASTDANYNGLAVASVTAAITDNDTEGVVVAESGGSTSVTEGGASDTYTVVLTGQPTANVTITLTPNSQLTATPLSLTFTAANWNVAQTVTVSALDDSVDEGNHSGTITHSAASTDPNYNSISISNFNVGIADNDMAGVVVNQSGGSTSVVEGGSNDSYTMVLTSQPTANVTFTLTPGSQLTVTPLSLTFTAANWNVPQTVTVSAVNDSMAEGIHLDTIRHAAASADPNYSGLGVAYVTITDNDTAGVTVTESGGSTSVSEGGAGDSYTVVLTSQPTSPVIIILTPGSQLVATLLKLTFTAANWNLAQTVTVSAVNDLAIEGTHPGSVTHAVVSGDPMYNGLAVAPVIATISDNDVATITDNDVAPAPHAVPPRIVASVVTKKVGKKKLLFIRVLNADTGAVKQEIRSPFQKPKYAGIVVSVRDANSDGAADTVVLMGRRGKKRILREFPA